MDITPGKWHWHDAFGRKDGQGEPTGIGRGIAGDEPKTGSCSRFSFAVSDDQGFVVAHCTNALVTMSSDRSEANARLISKAPEMYETLKEAEALLNGPIADLLTGDSMNDTGVYDVLTNIRAALAGIERVG
jgi:hypothetical protein